MSDAVWISIVGGIVSLLSLLMTLLIKKDVGGVKNTVSTVKEGQDKMKANQEEMNIKINGHMTKQIETTAELNKLIGEKAGRADLIVEQKAASVVSQESRTPLPSSPTVQEDDHLKDISDNTKKTADNTKKDTGPVSE